LKIRKEDSEKFSFVKTLKPFVLYLYSIKIEMKKSKLNHNAPDILESQRIAEIKSMSYLQRLERLMAILEVSYMLKTAKKQ
jgi:hypothetical protein